MKIKTPFICHTKLPVVILILLFYSILFLYSQRQALKKSPSVGFVLGLQLLSVHDSKDFHPPVLEGAEHPTRW